MTQKSNTRVFFILNPTAGNGSTIQYVQWIKQEASKKWAVFDIQVVQKKQSVAQLARQKSQSFDMIVACGGDGTINQVVNGIAMTDTTLGILPIGTGNDFVKSLKLPKTLSQCLELLFEEQTQKIDLIRYKGEAEGWCVNTLGCGLDGWTNYYADRYKHLPSNLKYLAGVLRAYLKFRGAKLRITIDSKTISDKFLMLTACNGKWEGSMFKLAPHAKLTDGIINLLTIKKLPFLTILGYLPQLNGGLSSQMDGIQYYDCKNIEIKSKNGIAIHVDGEQVGNSIHQLSISIEKKALTVVRPNSNPQTTISLSRENENA